MGSSGTGRLTDYPGSGRGRQGGSQGGSSGADQCKKKIDEQLEDVATSAYYKNHKGVPPTGTKVEVVQQKRISFASTAGEVIGHLPTQYNYLAACLADGFKYAGTVQ